MNTSLSAAIAFGALVTGMTYSSQVRAAAPTEVSIVARSCEFRSIDYKPSQFSPESVQVISVLPKWIASTKHYDLTEVGAEEPSISVSFVLRAIFEGGTGATVESSKSPNRVSGGFILPVPGVGVIGGITTESNTTYRVTPPTPRSFSHYQLIIGYQNAAGVRESHVIEQYDWNALFNSIPNCVVASQEQIDQATIKLAEVKKAEEKNREKANEFMNVLDSFYRCKDKAIQIRNFATTRSLYVFKNFRLRSLGPVESQRLGITTLQDIEDSLEDQMGLLFSSTNMGRARHDLGFLKRSLAECRAIIDSRVNVLNDLRTATQRVVVVSAKSRENVIEFVDKTLTRIQQLDGDNSGSIR